MLMKKQIERQRVWRRGQPQKPSPNLRRADLTLTLPLIVHSHPFALRINTPTLLPILGRKAFIKTTQVPLPSKASMGGHCICSEDSGFWGSRGRHDRSLEGPGCDSQEANVCYHGIHQGGKL